MKSYLVFCLLLVVTAASAQSLLPLPQRPGNDVLRTGLSDADDSADAAVSDAARLCDQVSFSRNLKYGESELNVLDVATMEAATGMLRPILLLVAGENFTGDGDSADVARDLADQTMCFAARNGMVGVRMRYRLAPAAQWPSGTRDVAAAASWIHQNIDLFNGDARQIVAVGYAAGAYHVASLLAHPEFQASDSDVAAVVLVSGTYRPSADGDDGEKSYFGTDASQYDKQSVFPGILTIEEPIVLAWAAADPARLVAQGEQFKEQLCAAGHCPRTTVLRNRDGLASVFGLDGSADSLAEPTLLLVRQLEARGLP
ncbi:MAG: carboxylesterase family protein [Bradyrhizobium sp.]|uniref:alpha/beta hydrolase n=1 Tax=Bradyrhizobium sp. TaxID=376 RepID=UPI0025C4DA60|nr:alpha/beta hydrolase [Bradyrhizobium sp.]MBI5264738.1 carboxylesterase family protein [Bradyrhizobium sp.]